MCISYITGLLTFLAICSPAIPPLKTPELPKLELLQRPAMHYSDTAYGRAFAKDPDVISFENDDRLG